ncbi:MAG: sialate O-acetylesterase [Acidovorax sp.]|uniref:sialate O-acetylesterase n=1 Tax=Acidovorax sp. TaxID=1872122 RepID=UPI0025C68106|nr:sialate O-acetylesterase [Acidovorax sp.]MCE1194383.1 sialate O-acetylesterase [Acidovorax sp.]
MQRPDLAGSRQMKPSGSSKSARRGGASFCLAFLVAGGAAHAQACYPAPAGGKNVPVRSLYVIAGQSNAVGLATVKDFVSGKFDQVRSGVAYQNVKIYGVRGAPIGVAGNDDERKSARVRWSEYAQWHVAQAGFGYKNFSENARYFPFGVSAGDFFGPELSLASMLNNKPPQDSYIAKLAVSNTSLHFDPAADSWSPSGRLYAELLRLIAEAHNSKRKSVRLNVAGIFFMQGETDALHEAWAKEYKSNIQEFVRKIRGDLYRMGCTEDPDVPLVVGRIQDNKLWTHRKYVRSAQNELARSFSKVEVIDTDEFSDHLVVGGVHFDEYAQFTLGKKVFQAFERLGAQKSRDSGPRANRETDAQRAAMIDGIWEFHCCDAEAGRRWLTQGALPVTYRYDGVCKSASCAVIW